ncbi:MAG: phosphoglycerate kinase [Planctomycetes bacterium]|nr:phosphoglycerate kinase [Planctomycetota bacterium]
MAKRRIDALGALGGKRVLVRVDFNVPLREGADGAMAVGDDHRLVMSLPTIRRLRDAGARVILGSHLGRPSGGKVEPEFSMRPVAGRLSTLLGAPVRFVPDLVGPEAQAAAAALKDGEVLLLENLRFDKGEKKGAEEFGRALAALAEVYVNDAFGVSHRGDASVTVPPRLLPAAAGDLVATELERLAPLRDGSAPRPYVVVMGGGKLADKIPVLEALVPKVDAVLIGGGMSYTFLKARGEEIGRSRHEPELLDTARKIMERAGDKLALPIDHVVAASPDDPTGYAVVERLPQDRMGLDIGPRTIADYCRRLAGARTVFWNGPLGVFEKRPFNLGTDYVASFLGYSGGVHTVVGGGDSAAAARELGIDERMGWVSTGGGASLEFVQGEALPGIEALPDA